MNDPTPTNCRSCGARIVFMHTKADKLAPFNSPPMRCPACDGVGCSKCDLGRLWVSHFSNCPNATQHSKKGRR